MSFVIIIFVIIFRMQLKFNKYNNPFNDIYVYKYMTQTIYDIYMSIVQMYYMLIYEDST